MLGFLLALNLSLLPPNSSLFDFNSPLVSGDYASTLPISIDFETQIKLFKFFYVGGGIDTIMHINSLETPLAGTPTYEEYTFDAGTDIPILFQNLPFDIPFLIAYLNIGWVHECIHPVHPYSQAAEWSLSQGGRYEGSYDLIFAKLHDEIQPVEFSLTQGYYFQHSFNDYMLGNDTTYWNSPLIFTGSSQRLQINIFFISLEEKIFFDKKTQNIQDDYFFTCQAEAGIDIYKHTDDDELKGSPEMIVGIRFNNVDPLAPLLWAENINFMSPWYFSIFIDIKLEGNLL